jgi:hypothetical protein
MANLQTYDFFKLRKSSYKNLAEPFNHLRKSPKSARNIYYIRRAEPSARDPLKLDLLTYKRVLSTKLIKLKD